MTPGALVYDLGMIVDGDLENARVGMVPIPESPQGSGSGRGYHDFYVGAVLIFPSGKMRHPEFVRWHQTKMEGECTLDSVLAGLR